MQGGMFGIVLQEFEVFLRKHPGIGRQGIEQRLKGRILEVPHFNACLEVFATARLKIVACGVGDVIELASFSIALEFLIEEARVVLF